MDNYTCLEEVGQTILIYNTLHLLYLFWLNVCQLILCMICPVELHVHVHGVVKTGLRLDYILIVLLHVLCIHLYRHVQRNVWFDSLT